MAFNKRTWKGRQGVGLNKFSINGEAPVTVVNQPDSITEVGDALSAGNLNDLEDRIADAFDETASQEEVNDLKNALEDSEQRIENLEQAVSGSLVQTNVLTDPPSMANVRTITNANTILPWALLNRVGARAVSWNQLANVGATVFGTKVNSFTFNANFSARNQTYQQTTDTIKTVSGHKYLLRIKSDGSPNLRTTVAGIVPFIGELTISLGYETILTGDGSDSYFNFTQSDVSLGGNGNIYINFFDLTAMGEYDSTLTDAQNIAKFRAKFPASYYPYNAGGIIDTNPSAFEVRDASNNLVQTIDTSFTSDYKYVNPSCHDYSENVLVDGQKMREEHKVVDSVVFDGSDDEGWTNLMEVGTIGNHRAACTLVNGQDRALAPLCIGVRGMSYNEATYDENDNILFFGNGNNNVFIVVGSSITTLSEFKNFLQNNPVTVYFAKATPITTLHNDPIPNFPSEDGTTITAITPQTELVNAIDVPNTIAYMTKIGG